MYKRYLAAATVAAATTLLAVPLPANATNAVNAANNAAEATNSAAKAAPAQPLKLRNGLTIYIPISWRVHKGADGVVQVVTGRCKKPQGWGSSECDAFYVFGPKYIKIGAEGFGPYTGKNAFYTASDVQPCPFNHKWGEVIGPKVTRGLRQVGTGHKAVYNVWSAKCVSFSSAKVRGRFTQREWYLPKSRILVVDQWNTPGLADVLKNADWN
jgi:hypothetical protein